MAKSVNSWPVSACTLPLIVEKGGRARQLQTGDSGPIMVQISCNAESLPGLAIWKFLRTAVECLVPTVPGNAH